MQQRPIDHTRIDENWEGNNIAVTFRDAIQTLPLSTTEDFQSSIGNRQLKKRGFRGFE
jgi:hypothetical protein